MTLAGQSLRAVVEALGADFSLASQTGFEANTGTLRDTLTHTDSHFTIELFHLSADVHDQERKGGFGQQSWFRSADDESSFGNGDKATPVLASPESSWSAE